MKNTSKTLLALLLVGVAALAQDDDRTLVIDNARIIVGDDSVIERGAIVVRDGRIERVAAGGAGIRGDRRIDAEGRTVMPGLIDAHRHVIRGDPEAWLRDESAVRMREFLEAGFTTVLSAGDSLEHILELRRRVAAGELAGPTILAAGRVPLAAGPRRFSPDVDPARIDVSRPPHRPTEPAAAIPPEETLRTVRALAAAGVDAFKTSIIVTPGGPEKATLRLIAEEARRLGIPSITHAVTVEDTVAAVEAGTHYLVHTPHIGQLDETTAKRIAGAGIPMTSTLAIFVPTFAESNRNIRNRTGVDNIPRFRDLEPFPMETLSSAGQGPVNARMLWDAGITYGYGTDTTFLPRDALAHELKPLQLVFSNRDIVTIMTRNAAAAVGRSHELGTLEAGKIADLVVLGGDPLADVDALLEVELVVKNGEIVVDAR